MISLAKTPKLDTLISGFNGLDITNKQKSSIIAENFDGNVEASSFASYYESQAKVDEYDLRGRIDRLLEAEGINDVVKQGLLEFKNSQYGDIFLLENYKKFIDQVSWNASFKKEAAEFDTFFDESLPHTLVAKTMLILENSSKLALLKEAYDRMVTCFSLPAKFVKGYVVANLSEYAMLHEAIHDLVESMKKISSRGLSSTVSYIDSRKGSVSTIKSPVEYADGFSFMAEGNIYTWDGSNLKLYENNNKDFIALCESFSKFGTTDRGLTLTTAMGNVIRIEKVNEGVDFVERDASYLKVGQLFSRDSQTFQKVDKVYEGKSYIMSNDEVVEGIVKVPNFTLNNIIRIAGNNKESRNIYEHNKVREFSEKYGIVDPIVQLSIDGKSAEVFEMQDIVDALDRYNISLELTADIINVFENFTSIADVPGAIKVSDGSNTSIFMKMNKNVHFHGVAVGEGFIFEKVTDPEAIMEHYDAMGVNVRGEFREFINERSETSKAVQLEIFDLKESISNIDESIRMINENVDISYDKDIIIHKRELMNEKIRLTRILEEKDGSDEEVDAIKKWIFAKDDQEIAELADNMGMSISDVDKAKSLVWDKFENKTNSEIISLAKKHGYSK